MSALMISAIGMTTSLGIDSVDSCAAARAGLVRLTEIDTLNTANDIRFGREDLDGIPMCVGHAAPVVASGRIGAAKLVALAAPALLELLQRARLTDEQLGRTGICLNVSDAYFQNRWGESPDTVNEFDSYPKFWRRAISDLPVRLSRAVRVSFSRRLQSTLAGGRVGLIDILDQAASAIDAGTVDRCVVGCIESCLEPEALQAYARAGILKTAANPTGFIPGEGAAFLLVEPAARNAAAGAALGIVGAAASQDAPYGESEAVCGNGIMAAISNALVDRQPGTFPSVLVADLNGTETRASDWGYALLRMRAEMGDLEYEVWLPASSFGETGAAAGALGLCMVHRAFERRYLPGGKAIIVICSEDGRRGAIAVDGLDCYSN